MIVLIREVLSEPISVGRDDTEGSNEDGAVIIKLYNVSSGNSSPLVLLCSREPPPYAMVPQNHVK